MKKMYFLRPLLVLLWAGLAFPSSGQVLASNRFRQAPDEKTVSANARQTSLRAVLSELETRFRVSIAYRSELLANRAIDWSRGKRFNTLDKALAAALDGQGLRVEKVSEGFYVLSEVAEVAEKKIPEVPTSLRPSRPDAESHTSEPLALSRLQPTALTLGQVPADVTVSGRVTDEAGAGLPGVNVSVKNTTRGTTTDGTGRFTLAVPDGGTVLVFSSVGYEKQEVTVGGRSTLNVTLKSDTQALEEVVIVGYGTQKKVNLTGAVSTVDSRTLINRPVANLANALQGTTPGLIVTRMNGQPGNTDGLDLQIRGVSSANGAVSPLVVLDGVTVPANTLQTLNPNDVESISVLKDAAAAAIYGAQAAGGVILITTKKGKAGKVSFDYLAQYGTDWALNVPGRMSLLDEALFANLANQNAGSGPEYSPFDLEQIRNNVPYVVNPADTSTYNFYNQVPLADLMLRKYTAMKTHNITARGGTDKFNFLISGGFYEKQGIFKVGPDNFKRFNLRTNLGAQLTKHLSLDTRLAYTNEKTRMSSAGSNGDYSLIYEVYRLRNRTPFLTPEGRYNGAGSAATTYAWQEAGGYNNYSRNFFDGVATLQAANFVKGLTLRAVGGVQYRVGDRDIFYRTVPLWAKSRILRYINQVNSYQVYHDVTRNTNLQLLANYDFKIGANHNFGLFAGYQWEDNRYRWTQAGATNLVSNDLPTLRLGDNKTKTNDEDIRTFAFQSVFGRFNYNFAGKYLFEATLRRDESSRLAPGLRTKVFPAASAGWNLHLEPFFNNALPFFSEFKVRGSWGRLGGALASNLGLYDYVNQLTQGSALVLGDSRSTYIFQNFIPSASLSWETIETSDVGLDFGFLRNRFQVTADYYVKFNRNMLTPQQLPATIGISTPLKNNGELKSWGWELELRYRDQIGKDFTYSVAANLSDNNNRLLSYSNRSVVQAGANGLIEGFPINTLWGYRTDGYFTTADEVKAWAFQDSRTGPGDVRYLDLDGDKRLTVGQGTVANHGDLVLLGTTQPRYTYGLTLNAQWRGFDFTVFFQGVGKRNLLPGQEAIGPRMVTWKQALAFHADYWTPENPDATFPRPFTGGRHNYLPSDKWTLNGAYTRMKNVQVGYTLPAALTERIRIARARFFFSGQDLLTLSRMGVFKNYIDPEARNDYNSDYPFFATASLGLNLSF